MAHGATPLFIDEPRHASTAVPRVSFTSAVLVGYHTRAGKGHTVWDHYNEDLDKNCAATMLGVRL